VTLHRRTLSPRSMICWVVVVLSFFMSSTEAGPLRNAVSFVSIPPRLHKLRGTKVNPLQPTQLFQQPDQFADDCTSEFEDDKQVEANYKQASEKGELSEAVTFRLRIEAGVTRMLPFFDFIEAEELRSSQEKVKKTDFANFKLPELKDDEDEDDD